MVLLISLILPANSSASALNDVSNIPTDPTIQFTQQDILSLEKYIFVDDNGHFILKEKEALSDGISNDLLKGQKNYFDQLNAAIDEGSLKANKNLEIEITNSTFNTESIGLPKISTLSKCRGVTTKPTVHYWGQSRKLNSCDASRFSADMYSLAAGYGTPMGVIGVWFPGFAVAGIVSAGYFSLVASRVDSHNSTGRGVELNVSWALIFTVKSQ